MTNSFIIAHEYATAVLDVCVKQNTEDKWRLALGLLSQISRNTLIQSLCYRLTEPNKIASILVSVYEDVQSNKIDVYIENFINLIARNKRILLLSVIYTIFNNLYDEYMGSVRIEVISARGISDEQLQKIIDVMTTRLRKQVHVVCRVNKDIFSGIIIRVGDIVIDGSIRGRIWRLRNFLKKH